MRHLLETIADISEKESLPVLLIGGHAVTALGFVRATYDVDLIVPRSAARDWQNAFEKLGYRLFHETAQFLQLESSPNLPLPPIDLMLVDGTIFAALSESRTSLTPLPTPSVSSLVALKLHAIKQPFRAESEKDWSDILGLLRANSLNLDNPELRAIVEKHGGREAIQRIETSL